MLLIAAALLAALASAGPHYCGNTPVKYNFTEAGSVAGFVWNTDSVTLTCGQVTTTSRANALATGIVVLCKDTQQGGYSRVTVLKQWKDTTYVNGSYRFTCPQAGDYITIGATSLGGPTVRWPNTVTYNFAATDNHGRTAQPMPYFE